MKYFEFFFVCLKYTHISSEFIIFFFLINAFFIYVKMILMDEIMNDNMFICDNNTKMDYPSVIKKAHAMEKKKY